MKNCMACLVSAAVIVCAAIVQLGTAAPVENVISRAPTKDELVFLAKILAPLKELAMEAEDLEALVERAAKDQDFAFELAKRQGAWDMDYGYGGGRFGKRQSQKRYDSFGIGGRFGRSVDSKLSNEERNH